MRPDPPASKKAAAAGKPPVPAAATGAAPPPQCVPVAIVEDDDRTRVILSEWINSSADFRCQHMYGDGETAWQQLPLDKPEIVLMDINLPKVNGVECVRRLHPLLPGTQFVMLTVYEDVEHIFAALSAGAVGYLLKRSSPDELIGALNYVRTGGSPMTTLIARKVVQAFPVEATPAPAEDGLSARERQVLELVARGYFYKEIAGELGITLNTVHTFIRRIYEKLHVRSRTEAISKYRQTPR